MSRASWIIPATLLAALSLGGTTGCDTEAFCFRDCEGQAAAVGSDGGTGGDATLLGGTSGTGTGGIIMVGGTGGGGGTGPCVPEGDEVCDGRDNDCNGVVDDGFDLTSPEACGTCENDCRVLIGFWVTQMGCIAPDVLDGTNPGTCVIEACDDRQYDLDGDIANGCEYYCNTDGTATVDDAATGCGYDDNCNGFIDEDLSLCDDANNCGACGRSCVIADAHATFACVSTAAQDEGCNSTNTSCEVEQCEAGYVDANGDWRDGCEYQCTPDGPEVCDGVDNDCDRLIDNADPDLESDDAAVGQPEIGDDCTGGEYGLCAARHGVTKCQGGVLKCCDPDSNDIDGTNPNFPTNGVRNSVCDATTGVQVLFPDELPDECNGEDDDCDGVVDGTLAGATGTSCTDASQCDPNELCLDGPSGRVCVKPASDTGAWCGTDVGSCRHGVEQCTSGQIECVGQDTGGADVCNGQDDDCDGVIDGVVAGASGTTCTDGSECAAGEDCSPDSSGATLCVLPPTDTGVPCPPELLNLPALPPGVSSRCQTGTWDCQGGVRVCAGAILPPSPAPEDTCAWDENCDGQYDFVHDPLDDENCDVCGNDCTAQNTAFADWTCQDPDGPGGPQSPICVQQCKPGYRDCDLNDGIPCEYYCSQRGDGTELCNTLDDDCDCYADAADPDSPPAVPSPEAACSVSGAATDVNCQTAAEVSGGTLQIDCVNGLWECTFAAGYCPGTAPDYCTGQPDPCDGLDNNCSGLADEAFKPPLASSHVIDEICYSDDGLPPPGHGVCRQQGQYVCNSAGDDTECTVAATPDLSQAGPETCNGLDDDCDGSIDEYYSDVAGSADGNYIQPAVVELAGGGPYIFAYEASRAGATAVSAGAGNGWQDAPPSGEIADRTVACSLPDKIPWTNITPAEVEQTCAAIGGRVCLLPDWQDTCEAGLSCDFGYASSCDSYGDYAAGPYCNLGGYDYSAPTPAGDQDGLLPTASGSLAECYAEWGTPDAYDITGNAREITRCQKDRAVCGGSSNTQAQCTLDCCSGTSSSVSGPSGAERLCGSLSDDRRLSGQPCGGDSQCCNDDVNCDGNGVCDGSICRNTGATVCTARGVSCTQDSDCCAGEGPCVSVCGGPDGLPQAVYPLMGGGYQSIDEDGATCTFDFYKVNPTFKLFDTGFRCCFDSDPR